MHRKSKQTNDSYSDVTPLDVTTDSTCSPTDELHSPVKLLDKGPCDYSTSGKKHEADPSKKHVSVSVPGVVKPKLTSKKKKVAPTLVS